MSSLKKKIFDYANKLPTWAGRSFLGLNNFKEGLYGGEYQNYKSSRILKNFESYDNIPEMLGVVNDAIQNVPYYRKKYFSPVNTVEDFQSRIGFIDKVEIMSGVDEFVSEKINIGNFDEGTTGGTSGKPLRLLLPKDRYVFELATMHFMWSTTGWNYHSRAVIRNNKLPQGKNFIINPLTKEFYFDNFRMDDDYMRVIYDTIKKFKIRFIHAYPSAAYQFASFLKNKKLDTSGIKACFSGSENIFDYQGDLIQKQLGIRFYNWYGHSEKLVLGGYCGQGNVYHIEPTYGYFELVNEKGEVVNTPGMTGEIVGTTLHNSGMPLIRYKTGDYAEYVGDYCPHCKRHLPLIKNIIGRWSGEKVFNKDGTFVTTTALNLHNDLYSVLNGIQYVQKEMGKIEILIIPASEFCESHEQQIRAHFKSKLKKDMEIEIIHVSALIKQPNGKFLHLISKL